MSKCLSTLKLTVGLKAVFCQIKLTTTDFQEHKIGHGLSLEVSSYFYNSNKFITFKNINLTFYIKWNNLIKKKIISKKDNTFL